MLGPILGVIIDRIGKRALFMILSSLMLIVTFTNSLLMPKCNRCYYEMGPLILLGAGNAIYTAVVWGAIPYTVEPRNLGTAYGIITSI